MKRSVLIPLLLTQALGSYASANKVEDKLAELNARLAALCANEKTADLKKVEVQGNSIRKNIADILNLEDQRLSYSLSGSVDIANNVSISLKKKAISEPSVGGNYSGGDKWILKGAAFPTLGEFTLGLSAARELTVIQQFKSRCQSLARFAYNPSEKIPNTAKKAKENLKAGDFVAFSAPVSLSLGKAAGGSIDGVVTGSLANASIFVTGEMNINIFRMEDNFIRVRFFALKQHGLRASVGPKFYALGDQVKFTPLEVNFSKTSTDLFSVDYIFNLNDEASVAMYNQIMGDKLSQKNITFSKKVINPLSKDNEIRNALVADLESIDQAAQEDENARKSYSSRRVIRLLKGNNNTDSSSFNVNLFGLIKKGIIRSEANLSQFNVENTQNNYKIISLNLNGEVKFRREDRYHTALLLNADSQFSPTTAKALQSVRMLELPIMTANGIATLNQRMRKTLPASIYRQIRLPDTSKMGGKFTNARLEQSLYLDAENLEALNIQYADILRTTNSIVANWGQLDAYPLELSPESNLQSDGTTDVRLLAKNNADALIRDNRSASDEYLAAYSWDIEAITSSLSVVMNGKLGMAQRLAAYDRLQNNQLFNEIGSAIILSVIPEGALENVVTYRLEISGRNLEKALISTYPANADLSKGKLYERFLNDNAIMNDRSFNLRYFLNENGKALSLTEVVERSK